MRWHHSPEPGSQSCVLPLSGLLQLADEYIDSTGTSIEPQHAGESPPMGLEPLLSNDKLARTLADFATEFQAIKGLF